MWRSLSSAWFQLVETISRNSVASLSLCSSRAYRTSRPHFLCPTSPAPSRTCKCLTIACRVTLAPCDRPVAERSPALSLASMARRVSSPKAKKMLATADSGFLNILSDILRLCRPPALVHAEGALPATCRNGFEAGFHDGKQGTLGYLFNAKLNQRRRLGPRINFGIDAVRNPSKAKVALRLTALYGAEYEIFFGQPDLRGCETKAFLVLLDIRLAGQFAKCACNRGAGGEIAFQGNSKPAPELLGVRDRLPNTRDGRAQDNALLDFVE